MVRSSGFTAVARSTAWATVLCALLCALPAQAEPEKEKWIYLQREEGVR